MIYEWKLLIAVSLSVSHGSFTTETTFCNGSLLGFTINIKSRPWKYSNSFFYYLLFTINASVLWLES